MLTLTTLSRFLRPPFAPLSLNPALFIEAYDVQTLEPDAFGPFSGINDKSGAGKHYTQSTMSNRPVSGTVGEAVALRFDGTDDNMTGSFVMPYEGTVFVVCEPKSTLSNVIFFGGNALGAPSNGRRYFGINSAGNWSFGAGTLNHTAVSTNTGVAAVSNTPVILVADFKGTVVDFYVNGGAPVLSNVSCGNGVPASATTIGRYQDGGYQASIAVAAIFCTQNGSNLTQAQRNALGQYFSEKTGVVWA